MTTRRCFLASACAGVLAAPAIAQQQPRVPRIAYLSANPAGDFRSTAFREGLREFGYTEGRDIVIEYFLAPGIADLPLWAARAVASRPDVIVTINTTSAVAAKARTTTIPVVFAGISNPIESGLVAGFAQPGGNLTGPSLMRIDVAAKLLQMLSEFVPRLTRVAVLYLYSNTGVGPLINEEILRAGEILNLDVSLVEVRTIADLAPAIASAASQGAQAIYFFLGPILANNPQLVADETLRHRLPSISENRIHADTGGLVAYGANLPATFRRAAYYVDRILKGAKPADLPVEQPTVFDLVINKKTADALGLAIPPHLQVLATEIIE
jgi:putative tryptophan/tyrosine transport system substrate-binding protein